ncbi:TetR family transcriptional regulator [Noviherbaspirillum galbum]|uniref:TetR family transcriptional regulator n=1 Tax=Noviherbaspirillum galbum TaxID=2709383 RepID=A0A6B3SUC2_9BURK|nr:TetR family transcriptional regulator [Noviherbaspirillum galbum]NEX64610.1 TetR family transcriptional regulator [Noviherbaspirillum galbum]
MNKPDPHTLFILGALDPEMREIARVLGVHRYAVAWAATGGQKCNSSSAYDADSALQMVQGRWRNQLILPRQPVVFVECAVARHAPVLRIDHHHPGDAGFDCRPHDFLRGSSLGQLLHLLGLEPDDTQRLLAAADHCLTSAYQGECPGVDPDELLFLRASWQAKMSSRPFGVVVSSILDAARLVRERYDALEGAALFLDPTLMVPDLPEGAARAGRPVRYRSMEPGGQVKEMLKGASAEMISSFMESHHALGRRVYGNPYRGYAGAYLN